MHQNWKPYTPEQLKVIMTEYDGSWWLAGGYALELYLGEVFRPHDDIDLIIPRNQQMRLQNFLKDWHLYVADGDLSPWQEHEFLDSPKNDIWVLRDDWFRFQIMFMDVTYDRWFFKRDHAIHGDLATFGLYIQDIPVIRPEIQLLYKFHMASPRPKDYLDWQRTYPKLNDQAKKWLDQYVTISF